MDRAIVIRPQFPSNRRVIAVSDIHGNLPFFQALMDQIRLSPEDILVLVGDMLEKGQDSLALLRHLMELPRTHTVYPLCGNCDGLVHRFFETDELDEHFFSVYLPTILETEHLVFVHGGIPSLERMEELDRWRCMKNDDFLGQGRSFPKWVIVGHWPVTLYDPNIPSAAPILLRDRKIASIDGGCVLKLDGQLNALILPSEDSEEFSWDAFDGLPVAVALDGQSPSSDSVNVRWGRSGLELLEKGEDTSLCRHLETGRVLPILNRYLRRGPNGLWCEDSTDYALPVSPGDRLTVVASTSQGYLCKKEGRTGWYYGRLSDIL